MKTRSRRPPGRPRKDDVNSPQYTTENVENPVIGAVDREISALDIVRSAFNDSAGKGEWLVDVYRIVPVPGRASRERWLFDCEVSELDNLRRRIAAEYGGGQYRARVQKDKRPFKAYDLEIELSVTRSENMRSLAVAAPAAPVADLGAILQQMQLQNQQFMETMLARMQPAAAPTGIKDVLEIMAVMEKMRPAPNIGLDLFKQGVEMATEIAASAGPKSEGNFMETVLQALNSPTVQKLLERAAMPAAAAIAPPPAEDDPEDSPAPFAAPVPPPLPMHQAAPPQRAADLPGASAAGAGTIAGQAANDPHYRTIAAYLQNEAGRGTDPAIAADWCLENVPGAWWDILEKADDPVTELVSIFPGMGAYRPWLHNLLTHCYDSDGEPEGEGDGVPVSQPDGADARPAAS